MSLFAITLLTASATTSLPAPPVRNVQQVQASVTIVSAESIDVRTPPAKGSAQATTRQHRERDRMPLVEFF